MRTSWSVIVGAMLLGALPPGSALAVGRLGPTPIPTTDAQVGQVVELNVDTDPQLERFTLAAAPDGVGSHWTLQDGVGAPSTEVGPIDDFLTVPEVFDGNGDGRPEFMIAGGGGSLGLFEYEVWQWSGEAARLVWRREGLRSTSAARGATIAIGRVLIDSANKALITETTAASGCRACPVDFRIRETFTYRSASDDWRFSLLERTPAYRAGSRRCRDVRLGLVQSVVAVRATGVSCFAARVILDRADSVRRGRRAWKSDGMAWRFRFEDEVSGRLTGTRGPQKLSGLRVTT